ncbi:MAG: thiamine pyridinylase [Kiritimatiellia bacterium]
MKNKFLWIVLGLVFWIGGCCCPASVKDETKPVTIALYAYVPDTAVFEKAILAVWSKKHPDVPVAFTSWDPYVGEPPEEAEVFVYDASRYAILRERNLLARFPDSAMERGEDFFKGALHAVSDAEENGNGRVVYGLPQMICSSFLITRKDDLRFESVRTLDALEKIVPKADPAKEEPSSPDSVVAACVYPEDVFYLYWHALQAFAKPTGTEPYAVLSGKDGDGATQAIAALRRLVALCGEAQMKAAPENAGPYFRMRYVAEGKAAAFIGYPESLNDVAQAEKYRIMPFSYGREDAPFFYINAAGVRPGLSETRAALAFDLAAIAASDEVMTAVCSTPGTNGSPQYLLPGRHSTLLTLAGKWPGYARLREIVKAEEEKPSGIRAFRGNGQFEALREELVPVLNQAVFPAAADETADAE